MAGATQTARLKKGQRMARPKQDLTKDSRIDVRMHETLRNALERIAKKEGRTLSQLCERTMRAFAVKYLRDIGDDVADIEKLP